MALPRIVERLAALGLFLAALMAVAAVGVIPLIDHVRGMRETLAHNADMIHRLADTARLPGLEDGQIDALLDHVAADGRFLRAETLPLAAAAMQQHIRNLLAAQGGDLLSIQTVPRTVEDTSASVTLRLSIRARFGDLAAFLGALESGKPYIFIDNLEISSANWRRQIANQPTDDLLTVQFDAIAHMPPAREN